MKAIKRQFEALNIPRALVDFDNDLADLIVKRLTWVHPQEVERLYGDLTLAQHIQEVIELEKKFPTGGDGDVEG